MIQVLVTPVLQHTGGLTMRFKIGVAAYVVVAWLTALYSVRQDYNEVVSFYVGTILWPVFWFIETVRIVAGVA